MTLSIWDTMAIAGFTVLWLFLLWFILTALAAFGKRARQKRQKDEIYEKVMQAIKTDEDFSRIVRNLQKESDNE
jgi:hypothetical protein